MVGTGQLRGCPAGPAFGISALLSLHFLAANYLASRQIALTWLLLWLAGALFAPLPAQADGQLSTNPQAQRNLTPIANLFGLPRPLGARVQNGWWVNAEIGNNYTAANNLGSGSNSAVFLDGETSVISLAAERPLIFAGAQRWHWGFELPWVTHAGGFLDAPIDEFHELFGFTDGGRSLAPRGRLDYLLLVQGEILARFQDSKSGIGDVRGWLGFQWLDTSEQQLAIRGQLKLPTGKLEHLRGSDSTDTSLWIEYARQHDLGNRGRVGWHVAAGVGWLAGGRLREVTEDFYSHAALTGFWQWHPRWQLHAGFAAQSQLLDTGLKQAQGSAFQLNAGLRFGVSENWQFDFGFVEDIRARSSADIVFTSQLRRRL